MRPPASLDARLYRAAQYLYPPAFRRAFSEEIVRVFDESRLDTETTGDGRALWLFRARMGADLADAIVRQWLRSGWPAFAGASLLYSLTMVSALASVWRRAPLVLPKAIADADVIALTLLAAIVLVVIATTIILTLWFTRPLLYRRRI
jgi:hypothetical protein